MNVIVKGEQWDNKSAIHITLYPEQMKLGAPYEVPQDDGSVLKVRLIDRQDSTATLLFRFDLIAVVTRNTIAIVPEGIPNALPESQRSP